MQRWKGSQNIYYMGKKTTGARIYFKFVPGEYKVQILAYSDKSQQSPITDCIVSQYDN